MTSFLGFILYEIATQLGTQTAVITPYDSNNNSMRIAALFHDGLISDPETMPEVMFIPDLLFMERLMRAKPFALFDVEQDAELHWPGAVEYLRARGLATCASFPIVVDGKFFGQISLAYALEPSFSLEQTALINTLSIQAALAIQLDELTKQASEAAVLSERSRVAGNIHDSLAQSFAGVSMQLEAAEDAGLAGDVISAEVSIARAKELARFGLAEARRSVMTLRPSQFLQKGLEHALAVLMERSSVEGLLDCTFKSTGEHFLLDGHTELELLRIAQEAVSNAIRHGKPKYINLELLFNTEELVMTITDNGGGISPEKLESTDGGLWSMRERCKQLRGQFSCESNQGLGTRIRIRIPIRVKTNHEINSRPD